MSLNNISVFDEGAMAASILEGLPREFSDNEEEADDKIPAQLAAAGPVGVAAASAIASVKKKRPYSFETNPSIRKRTEKRLLKKLNLTINELIARVGLQAVLVVATPGELNTDYKVFGAKPLQDVVKKLRLNVLEKLEIQLTKETPPPVQEDPTLFYLPPLVFDGIPTPIEKLTQNRLRSFIPLMLKYATGRGKPGWGRERTRPIWWPTDLPWANVRSDCRSEDEKAKYSWTHALRQVILNCYKYHGREDLLPALTQQDKEDNITAINNTNVATWNQPIISQTVTNPDDTVNIAQLPSHNADDLQGITMLIKQEVEGESDLVLALQSTAATEVVLNSEGQIISTDESGCGYPVSENGIATVPVSAPIFETMLGNIHYGTICVIPGVDEDGNETLTVAHIT